MKKKFNSLQDIYDYYNNGGTLASLTNLTQRDLDDLQAYAYTCYQSGDIISARNIYHLLAYLEHWNYDYTLSLGLCHQRLSNHEEAQLCFARCATLVMQDPRASYYSGISYIVTGDKKMAKKAFKACLMWCNGNEDYSMYAENIKKILAQN
ncbi:CesD/SycD/LcrH family type III secretion system chaperone [Salmonella enterica]|nr:CesD/SycD/LcrH family type III secretion system chaperone [Salmonella enterica]